MIYFVTRKMFLHDRIDFEVNFSTFLFPFLGSEFVSLID